MIRAKYLLLLAVFAALSNGCAHTTKLYPIEKSDIQPMKKGVAYTPEKDGYFISDLFMKEVMDAKVEAIKRSN